MFKPLSNQAFLLNPTNTHEHMRRNHPVYRYEESATPITNVFSYQDVKKLLRKVDTFSNTLTGKHEGKGATNPYRFTTLEWFYSPANQVYSR